MYPLSLQSTSLTDITTETLTGEMRVITSSLLSAFTKLICGTLSNGLKQQGGPVLGVTSLVYFVACSIADNIHKS